MSEQDLQPVFSIEKIYVKDLSLKSHAPQIFRSVSSRNRHAAGHRRQKRLEDGDV